MANELDKRQEVLTLYPRQDFAAAGGAGPHPDFHWYLRVLIKRKWLIAGLTLFALLPAILYSLTIKPLYRSSVRVQVNPESVQVLPYKEVSDMVVSDFQIYFETQQELMKNPTLARRVIDQLQLDVPTLYAGVDFSFGRLWNLARQALGFPVPPEEPAPHAPEKIFLGHLDINPIRSTRLVEIAFLAPDPSVAAQVVDTLAKEYVKLHFEKKYQVTQKATEFLRDQLLTLKSKVESAEEELIRYAQAHGIMNLSDEKQDVIRQRLEDLNQKITEVEGQYFSRRARYMALKNATAEEFPESLSTPVIEQLETKVFELEQELVNLSARFGKRWPEVLRVQEEIQKVQDQLRREKASTLAQAVRQADLEHTAAQQEYEMLREALDRQKSLTNELNQASVQYNILRRDVDTNKELYQGLLQRLKQTGVAAGLEFGNIQVIETPIPAQSPNRPRKALNLSLALLFGLGLGIAAAIAREYLDRTVRSPAELEETTQLPTLGLIPGSREKLISRGDRRPLHLRSRLLLFSASRQEAGASVASPDEWMVWEAFRGLRASLLLASEGKPRKILVTSAVPKEGKTTTVFHMGIVLAQAGKRTVVVDLDLRRPSLADRFGLPGTPPGSSDYLSNGGERPRQVRRSPMENLYVLPAGPVPSNPAELLSSGRLKDLLESLGELFEFVLVDSPPVLTVADAKVVAPHTDGVLLVVRAGSTPREAAALAGAQLTSVGATILGAVLNDIDLKSPDMGYGQYYYDKRYYSETQGS